MSDFNSNQPTRLYPRPSHSAGLRSALGKLAPFLKLAQRQLAALPQRPMGENGELVRIATAKELMNIVSNTCHNRLIIDVQLKSISPLAVVVATAYVLTEDNGYQPVRSATANEQYGVYDGREIMSAQNRAIRLVLRSFGLRANDDDLLMQEEKGFAQKEKERAEAAPAEKKPPVANKGSVQKQPPTKEKATVAQPDSAVSKKTRKPSRKNANEKAPVSKVKKETSVDNGALLEGAGVAMPDPNSVTFRDDLIKGLNALFAKKPKSLKKTVFIQSVLGRSAPNRLEMQSVPDLIKLFEHYTSSDDQV